MSILGFHSRAFAFPPLTGRAAAGWSWLVSSVEGSAGLGCLLPLQGSARRSGRDGRSARTGRQPASRARLFDPEPRSPARQGRTLRGRYGASCRAAPGAPVPARLGRSGDRSLPEQVGLSASSTQDPGMAGQRLSRQRPEPYPASFADASGASLVRPDRNDIAKVERKVKNKKGTQCSVPPRVISDLVLVISLRKVDFCLSYAPQNLQ